LPLQKKFTRREEQIILKQDFFLAEYIDSFIYNYCLVEFILSSFCGYVGNEKSNMYTRR